MVAPLIPAAGLFSFLIASGSPVARWMPPAIGDETGLGVTENEEALLAVPSMAASETRKGEARS